MGIEKPGDRELGYDEDVIDGWVTFDEPKENEAETNKIHKNKAILHCKSKFTYLMLLVTNIFMHFAMTCNI